MIHFNYCFLFHFTLSNDNQTFFLSFHQETLTVLEHDLHRQNVANNNNVLEKPK